MYRTAAPSMPVARTMGALVTAIATTVAVAWVSPAAAQAAPVIVTTWSGLSDAFSKGSQSNPVSVVLGADIAAPPGQNLTVPSGATAVLDLATHDLAIATPSGGSAAVAIPDRADLTIAGTTGSLTAANPGTGAGIGGNSGWDATGDVTITGGTVNAGSNQGGAGIGSGEGSGSAGAISITGGTVNATNLYRGAGIGSGEGSGSAGAVTITGGTVNATGSEGAGIGSGRNGGAFQNDGAGGTVTISGGNVSAHSHDGAGIGSGLDGGPADVTLTGGVTSAYSQTASGIGGDKWSRLGRGTLTVLGTPATPPLAIGDGGSLDGASIVVQEVDPPRYFTTARVPNHPTNSLMVSFLPPVVSS